MSTGEFVPHTGHRALCGGPHHVRRELRLRRNTVRQLARPPVVTLRTTDKQTTGLTRSHALARRRRP